MKPMSGWGIVDPPPGAVRALGMVSVLLCVSGVCALEIVSDAGDRNASRSGMYVGGIGAGGFEVRPDGCFHRCRMFNDWRPERDVDIHFIHRSTPDGTERVLRLRDVVMSHRVIRGVDRIRYTADFPAVSWSSPELPVRVEFRSFFIPGNVKDSALPAVQVRVRNDGDGEVTLVVPMPGPTRSARSPGRIVSRCAVGTVGIHATGASVLDAGDEFFIMGYPFVSCTWRGRCDEEAILAWHSPGMQDFDGRRIGCYYERFFRSCDDVLDYVVANRERLAARTEEFRRSIRDAVLPESLKDAYGAQLASFVKQSWLSKRGDFGVWEGGLSSMGMQTLDIGGYGSWLYVNLFPELERSAIQLSARFQQADGWMPHTFPGTFERPEEPYWRLDLNLWFALMAARDAILWRDNAFLRRVYPAVKRAMRWSMRLDTDGDGIPNLDGRASCYDLWEWKGNSTYFASLTLGAAALWGPLARSIGDEGFARECAALRDTVRDSMLRKLWNGEYFILWEKGGERDEGCLLDALPGEWYAMLLGRATSLPEQHVRSHIDACVKYNRRRFDPALMRDWGTPGEQGWCYIGAGYPDGRSYHFYQYEPWTGLEYTLALNLHLLGQTEQALEVVREVGERKLSCGMFFNHILCGGDYYQPMVLGALWERLAR